jgi:hypothetical protein
MRHRAAENEAAGFDPGVKTERCMLLRDLDRLREIEQQGKHFVLRTPVTGDVGRVFQALGIALPPNIRDAEPAAPVA